MMTLLATIPPRTTSGSTAAMPYSASLTSTSTTATTTSVTQPARSVLHHVLPWTRQQQQEWVGNMGGFANFGAMMSVPHFMVARGINWIGVIS